MEEAREYSQRLGVIRREQLEAACRRFGLGRLNDAEPAPGGLFGQNIFLDTDAGAFVLRGHQHGDWQLAKERWFVNLVHAAGTAPVPWPYEIDDDAGIFGWPYAVMPRLAGTSGEHAFGGNQKAGRDPKFAAAAGAALGRLHHTPVGDAGLYDLATDTLVPHQRPYAEPRDRCRAGGTRCEPHGLRGHDGRRC